MGNVAGDLGSKRLLLTLYFIWNKTGTQNVTLNGLMNNLGQVT